MRGRREEIPLIKRGELLHIMDFRWEFEFQMALLLGSWKQT
jgi:hypothetical protein